MRLKKFTFVLLTILFFGVGKNYAQISHELGIIAGPVAFQSDYGEDKNFDNIKGNIGFSIGIVHYINMALNQDCDCFNRYTYFNDHFLIRNEFTYMNVKLDHFGFWVNPERTTVSANQLRAMHGEVNNLSLGTQLEYTPIALREFLSGSYIFIPYVALGVQGNYFMPNNYSELGNFQENDAIVPSKYRNERLNNGSSIAMSVTANLGIRLKLTRDSDLTLDMRYQYYMSDWVEGMKPLRSEHPENEDNDSAVWLTMGYIFYL